jgi:hypothetical protein
MNILNQIEEYTPGKYLKLNNIPTDKKLFLSQYRDEVHQTLTLMKLYNQYLIDNNLVAAETDNRRLNALIDELTNDMIILNRNVNKLKEDRYSKTTLEIIKVLRTSINYYEGLDEYLALLSLRLVEMNKRLVTQIRILYSKY